MSNAEILRKLGANYAGVLREAGDAVLADPEAASIDPTVREHVGRVRDLAKDTERLACSPVKIGVVGEFSAGKTLLLGSLFGTADGLPAHEAPTTGNVTALHFETIDDLRPTEVGPFTIEYLGHSGVEECMRFLLDEAHNRASAANLSEELIADLGAVPIGEPSAMTAVEKWCGDAWRVSNNPNLRYLIRELTAFARAYANCGAGLCSGPETYTVPAEKARRGLELQIPERELQSLAFSDLPPAPPPLSSPPDVKLLTADQIRATFPLIRRVAAKVTVSKAIWDLSGLGDADRFELLDFPGLGAANSGTRDLFLCLRELETVQTVLILLRGDKPGSGEGAQLYNFMQKHREGDIRDTILVGVGRFDKLPLKSEDLQKIREMTGVSEEVVDAATFFGGDDTAAAPPPLSEAQVFANVPILRTCIQAAQDLAAHERNDRIVLMSPMLHFKWLQQQHPGTPVGSPEFLTHLPGDSALASERAGLWKTVVDRLSLSDPATRSRAGLTRWLSDFATDGGIGRLRALLQSHVQTHGLQQLAADTQRRAEKLRREVDQLRQLVRPEGEGGDTRTSEDRLEQARQTFGHLAEFYQEQVARLRQAPPPRVERDGVAVELSQVVQDEVAFRIYEWDQWTSLWQSSRNGYLTAEERHGSFFGEGAEAEDDEESFPTRGEDFYAPFERTLGELEDFTRGQIEASLDWWLGSLGDEVAPARHQLEGVLQSSDLTARLSSLKIGKRGANLPAVLRAVIEPKRLKSAIYNALGVPGGDPAALDLSGPLGTAQLFPVARSQGKEVGGRVFAWSGELGGKPEGSRPDRNLSHQSQILRLRDDFVTTVSQELGQRAGSAAKRLQDAILRVLGEVNQKLSLVAGNDLVLDALLSDPAEDEAAAAEGGDLKAQLLRLTSVAWPL